MKLLVLLNALALVGLGCSHTQLPIAKPATTKGPVYVISEDASGVGTARGVGGAGHDCDKEHVECFDRCWNAPRPPYPHRPNNEWYHEYCVRTCREQYEECVKEMEKPRQEEEKGRQPLKFVDIDKALDWLRNHKAEVAIGTVVVVAGVAFVVATGGTGALILVPAAL